MWSFQTTIVRLHFTLLRPMVRYYYRIHNLPRKLTFLTHTYIGNIQTANLLILNNANINVADNTGETPLLLAVKNGN